jgi:hypothetical protein
MFYNQTRHIMKSHDNLRNACKTLLQFFQRVARIFAALGAESHLLNRPLQRTQMGEFDPMPTSPCRAPKSQVDVDSGHRLDLEGAAA